MINSVKVGVKITSIVSDSKEYISRIRNKNYGSRICIAEKLAIKKEYNLSEELYRKRLAITKSQRELLNIELEDLCAKLKNGNRKDLLGRLNNIYYYLGMDDAVLEKDGIIGVGSKFSIKLFRNGEEISKNLEMINRAVSDECDYEYIERISPLGSKLYGLSEGDNFNYRDGKNRKITGYVYNIDNSFSKDSNNYQYKKVDVKRIEEI